MLTQKVIGLLNAQINKEYNSAYLYLEMNNYFKHQGLDGFAHWYLIQSKEECEHAMKIYNYLHSEDCTVSLHPITKPETHFNSIMDVVLQALAHEEYVTESINAINAAAFEANDYRTMQFLDWFVAEQAEEETNARDMITKLKLYGDDAKGLYLLNHELSKRQ